MPLTWPSALPGLPIEADFVTDDNVIVTDTEVGPRKKRRRYTAASQYVDVKNWHLSGSSFITLKDFYDFETESGVLSFDMPFISAGLEGVVARFDGMLRWQVIVPSTYDEARVVRVDFRLEVLP